MYVKLKKGLGMKIKKVGKRGLLFTFFELKESSYDCVTNVYVINGFNYFFICDTYLGPYYMKMIKEYLETNYGGKKYLVFNSHSHWDHIWGNSEFSDTLIISREKCRDLIKESGKEELTTHINQFAKEDINLVLPNLTYSNKIIFENEGIQFFNSPGHSEDSGSCYDFVDQTLFVGDNLEDPIPYLCWSELDKYLDTLQNYLFFGAKTVVQSHGEITDNGLIKSNLTYLKSLREGKEMNYTAEEVLKKHLSNVNFLKLKKDGGEK